MKLMTTLKNAVLLAAMSLAFTGAALAGGTTPPTSLYTANGGDIEQWNTSESGSGASELTTGTEENSSNSENGNATDVAISSNGTLYVAATATSGNTVTISSYDGSLNEINGDVASFDSNGQKTNSMVIVGNTLYALANSQIQTVNLTSGAVTQLGDNGGEGLNNLIVSNGVIYTGAYQSGNVETIDAATGSVINGDFITMPNGYYSNPISMVIYGTNIFVADATASPDESGGQAIYEYNLATGAGEGPTDGSGNLLPYINVADGDITGISIYDGYLYVSDADGVQEYTLADSTFNDTMDGPTGEVASSFSGLNPVGEFVATGINDSSSGSPGAVPEPRSWMLGCLVLSLCGVLLRRRMVTE
jgi:hypothetical protein